MHRNTYLCSPRLLSACFESREHPGVFFAGQLAGVEGYVESAASGLTAARGRPFPADTAIGALGHYVSRAQAKGFQPMNVNFGLLPPLQDPAVGKKDKKKALAQRALDSLKRCIEEETQ
jgi:methylenetetrahydrofolate--tRNA-(uracil-5-)-methyltransferase